jgi:serine/threonine protein kinase
VEGRVLAGRYRLTTKLGQAGMGSVWRAEHLVLGSPLAIKLIDPGIAQTEETAARFRREAQAAACLRSVHVVQVFDYGVDSGTNFQADPYAASIPWTARSEGRSFEQAKQGASLPMVGIANSG